MTEQFLKSKFKGALVGTGIGDSLGVPFEGSYAVGPEEIEAVAERREVLTYTDDTHMMIGVAESLLGAGGFDGEDMASAFVRNFELEPFRGYGPGPPRIFRMIRAGVPWDEAAQRLYHGGSFGNGSAMRVAPIGVLYRNDPAALKDIAFKSSRITHSHQLGMEGAALQAYAIALATDLNPEETLRHADFLAKLTSFVSDSVYQEKLDSIAALLNRPDKGRVIAELGNGIEAFNSVPAAIFSFLSQPHSFAGAVLQAVGLGGDADTIGAMAGAISGAYLGIESIPAKWRDKLENREYLEELADRLWLELAGKY